MAAKYGEHHVEPGAYVDELVVFTPATFLGYNSSDELIMVKKKTSNGGTFVREIVDPDVTDYTIDRWVEYTRYRKTRGGE